MNIDDERENVVDNPINLADNDDASTDFSGNIGSTEDEATDNFEVWSSNNDNVII